MNHFHGSFLVMLRTSVMLVTLICVSAQISASKNVFIHRSLIG